MTDAGEKLEQRYTKWLNESFDTTNPYTIFDLVGFARAELELAAEIAKHFAQDELTEEEWPTSGLAEYGQRADAGVIRRCAENIAAAIRKLKE